MKNKENKDENYYSAAWGWAAAAARFRGFMCVVLSVCLIASIGLTLIIAKEKKIIVGITESGRPEVLERVERSINIELFCREINGLLFSYGPGTIEENFQRSVRYFTPEFHSAYAIKLGKQFTDLVKENGVVQVSTVIDVKVQDLSETGLTAIVDTSRLKSDTIIKRTTSDKVTLRMNVERGAITTLNPWGLYVASLVETFQ